MKHLWVALGVCAMLVLTTSVAVFAQDADPSIQVKAFLTGKGYTVGEADHVPDEQGKPRPTEVFVSMDAVSEDLDNENLALQAVWGFVALRQYYPRASGLWSALLYKHFWILFPTSSADLDKFLKKTIRGDAYWRGVRSRVKIYDLTKQSFVDEKNFTSTNQTDKDQTGKDFGKNPPNPVPTPVPAPAGKGSSLRLEPSTTYVPADAKTEATLIATLLDPNFAPLANRSIDFSIETPGQDAQEIGIRTTDGAGTARASVKSGEEFDSMLLRASTESLNSQISILAGPPVTTKPDQIKAVVKALLQQGYADVEAEYYSHTAPTGETTNAGIVVMRIASQSFDRAVYSQMSRAFGTLRTVFPKANFLYVVLIYRKDGREWGLWWSVNAAYWDQFVAGKIGENDFWRYVQYEGAWDENNNPIGDKNFVDKNFGAGTGEKEARITRPLESTLTKETWGDQWHGQEFVILPGSYAATFTVTEMSGNATAIQIFQAPDFTTPVVTCQPGECPDSLKKVRLGQGQYLFAVVASSAPATARVIYIEHLPQ